MRYVIIGNSAAAIGGVEGIRRVDAASPIALISAEPHHTYSRPLISYLLWGKTDEERMLYRPRDYYEKMGVTPLLGCTATTIDPAKQIVRLADGRDVPYDKLLVATGSRPFVPPMAGLDQVEKKFSFLTLDDARGEQVVLFSYPVVTDFLSIEISSVYGGTGDACTCISDVRVLLAG